MQSYTILYSEGAYPNGSLVQASGFLYGLTSGGGSNGNGVVFSFDPVTVAYTKLYEFNYNDGASPNGDLLPLPDGKLYGMTQYGGNYGDGVIFSFDPTSATNTTLFSFKSVNGVGPNGSLLQASDGKLYGMTEDGGSRDSGVVFSYNINSATFQKSQDFTASTGGFPHSTFVEVSCTTTKTFYKDADGDGFGDLNSTASGSCTPPSGYVKNSDDCNDANKNAHPGATEVCDGVDNNCDGVIDEGCPLPNFRINDVAVPEGNSGQKQMRFEVMLNIAPYRNVTVNYNTANYTATAPGDYVAASGTLTFTPGTRSQFVTIMIKGDKKIEPDETFRVKLSNATNAHIVDAIGVGTILTDDKLSNSRMMSTEGTTAESRSVVMAPNPASNMVNLRLNGYSGSVMVQLVSVQGKLLREVKLQGSGSAQQQLNVGDIANGMYMLVITDEKGYQETLKLVVVH